MKPNPGSESTEAGHPDQPEQFRRKLWFDYLSKINDRELHENQLSGATDWVLTGVLGVILYRGVPLLPTLLRIPNLVRSASIMFTLLANGLVFVLFAIVSLLNADGSGQQPRVAPKSRKSVGPAALFALTGLAGSSWWLIKANSQPWYVHGIALVSAISWTLVLLLAVGARSIKRLHVKLYGAELPTFTTVKIARSRVGLAILLISWTLAAASCYALIRYLWLFQTTGEDWVTPLSTAAWFLLGTGILLTLYHRLESRSARNRYLDLERDIVLEGLTSDDIRQRFTAELIGLSVSEWINVMHHKFKKCNEQVAALQGSLSKSLQGINNIPADFHHERTARAEQSLKEALTVVKAAERSLVAVHLQLPKPDSVPSDLTQALKIAPIIGDFKTHIKEFTRDIAAAAPLCKELEEHAGMQESDARKLIEKICSGGRQG